MLLHPSFSRQKSLARALLEDYEIQYTHDETYSAIRIGPGLLRSRRAVLAALTAAPSRVSRRDTSIVQVFRSLGNSFSFFFQKIASLFRFSHPFQCNVVLGSLGILPPELPSALLQKAGWGVHATAYNCRLQICIFIYIFFKYVRSSSSYSPSSLYTNEYACTVSTHSNLEQWRPAFCSFPTPHSARCPLPPGRRALLY